MGWAVWLPEEDLRLLELCVSKTFSEIDRERAFPSRSRNALIGRFHRLTAHDNGAHREVSSAPNPVAEPAPRHVSAATVVMPKASLVSPATAPKSIWQLADGDCRFPLPAPAGATISHVFCGEAVAWNTSYCAKHARRMFTRK